MDQQAYTIRKAKDDDLKEMMRVLKMVNFHHIPSPEMPELEIDKFFVAEIFKNEPPDTNKPYIVGLSGYKIMPNGQGKTTLMAVDPAMRGSGLGTALQVKRLQKMYELGAVEVITNADLPQTIAWYKKHFNYRKIGTIAKEHTFGSPEIDHWTTLKMDLDTWTKNQKTQATHEQ